MDKFISENLLTAEEVSRILRIPLPTIYRLTQQAKIRAVKIGKHWRYRKEDIERYLQFGTDFSREPSRRVYDTLENAQGPASLKTFLNSEQLSPADKAWPLNERRAYPRINTNFKCNYSIDLPPFKIIRCSGIIKNLSAGGVFCIIQDKRIDEIEIDDPVDLNFIIENTEINAKGKVVRKTKDGLGIKFKNINKEMQNRITEYTV